MNPDLLEYVFLASSLHDSERIKTSSAPFLKEIETLTGLKMKLRDQKEANLPRVVFIASGGTEASFRALAPKLPSPVILLSYPAENSLPASLEILSWLQARGRRGIIIHGCPEEVSNSLVSCARIFRAVDSLKGARLGQLGPPSDWLIASRIDPPQVESRWGIKVVELPLSRISPAPKPNSTGGPSDFLSGPICDGGPDRETISAACYLTDSLRQLIKLHELDAVSLRCFDLLGSWKNTGCVALAQLNDLGIPAACEGDLFSLFTLLVARLLTGIPGFMANPAYWNSSRQELILAHCTVPLSILESYCLDTHFESGIGVGIRGNFLPSDCTIMKIGGEDLSQIFFARGKIIKNLSRDDLCRTQILVRLEEDLSEYLLHPLGNHLIVIPGDWSAILGLFSRMFF